MVGRAPGGSAIGTRTASPSAPTTAATIPLCLWDYENRLKLGDKLILAAFGGGFTWAGAYLTWAYDGAKAGGPGAPMA